MHQAFIANPCPVCCRLYQRDVKPVFLTFSTHFHCYSQSAHKSSSPVPVGGFEGQNIVFMLREKYQSIRTFFRECLSKLEHELKPSITCSITGISHAPGSQRRCIEGALLFTPHTFPPARQDQSRTRLALHFPAGCLELRKPGPLWNKFSCYRSHEPEANRLELPRGSISIRHSRRC